jgi:Na+/melibiose symporter-like transporter
MSQRRPSFQTKLFYAFGSVAYGVKDNGFSFFLLLYYNQVLGLPERLVGLGIMLTLVFDAISDPIVGYVSDHLDTRWGRRHPFLYASVLPIMVSYYCLWNPPHGLSDGALFAYFLVVAITVRTMVTFYEIPSSSLIAELTDDYDERTQILGMRFFFGWWGGLGMALLAYGIFLQPTPEQPVGVLNEAGYRTYGMFAACIMGASILASALGTHRHIPHLRRPPVHVRSVRETWRELRATFANRSFRAILVSALFAAMAAGLLSSLGIYFNTFFWELTSSEIVRIVLGNFLSATIALVAAPRLGRRFGKKPAALGTAVSAVVIGPLPIVLRLAGVFPDNGSPLLLPLLFGFNALSVTLIITMSILTASMIADLVEDNEVATGQRSEGVFFSANSFVQKCVSGAGVFLSTVMLNTIGFPSDAKPGEVDPAVVQRLGLVFIPLLFVLYGLALTFLSRYRISRSGHEENLRRLASESF